MYKITETDLKTDSVEDIKIKKDIGKVPINRLIPLVHFKKNKEGFITRDFAYLTSSTIEQACTALAYYQKKKNWLVKIRTGSKFGGTFYHYFVSDNFPVDEAVNTIKIGQTMKDPTILGCIQKLIEFEAKRNGYGD